MRGKIIQYNGAGIRSTFIAKRPLPAYQPFHPTK